MGGPMARATAEPAGNGNGAGAEAAPKRAALLTEELARLAQQPLPAQEFHAELLTRVTSALRAVAGAVWVRTGQGELSLSCQMNLAEIGLDRVPDAQTCHAELLRQ